MEVAQRAVVDPAAAAGAEHRHHARIAFCHVPHHVVERPLVVGEQVLLLVGGEEGRAGLRECSEDSGR